MILLRMNHTSHSCWSVSLWALPSVLLSVLASVSQWVLPSVLPSVRQWVLPWVPL